METNINKMSEEELNSLGYELYESKERLLLQLEQTNRNLLFIRGEKQKRAQKEAQKLVESPKKLQKK